jgi:uncharacterized membrane protein
LVPLAALGLVSWRAGWRDAIWGLESGPLQKAVRRPVVAALALGTLAACFAPPLAPSAWHLPLLNPADLSVAVGVWVLALHWTASGRSLDDRRLCGIVALAVLGLSSAVARVVSAHFGMPFTLNAALAHTGLQAALSLLWSILALALLAFSRRRESRFAWRVGIGLLALTTVKLLVVDLSAAGTLARIVSFIGVGLLFVLVAFLMPVPNRSSDRA